MHHIFAIIKLNGGMYILTRRCLSFHQEKGSQEVGAMWEFLYPLFFDQPIQNVLVCKGRVLLCEICFSIEAN